MIAIEEKCPECGNTKCRVVSHQVQCLKCLLIIRDDKPIKKIKILQCVAQSKDGNKIE